MRKTRTTVLRPDCREQAITTQNGDWSPDFGRVTSYTEVDAAACGRRCARESWQPVIPTCDLYL